MALMPLPLLGPVHVINQIILENQVLKFCRKILVHFCRIVLENSVEFILENSAELNRIILLKNLRIAKFQQQNNSAEIFNSPELFWNYSGEFCRISQIILQNNFPEFCRIILPALCNRSTHWNCQEGWFWSPIKDKDLSYKKNTTVSSKSPTEAIPEPKTV